MLHPFIPSTTISSISIFLPKIPPWLLIPSAAHAPLITAADSLLLDLDDYSQLSSPNKMIRFLEGKEVLEYRRFRAMDDSRFIALTLPRVAVRLPYGRKRANFHPGGISFEEEQTSKSDVLWGNRAFALAQRICNAFNGKK